jgi:hypothetical protein
MVHSWQGEAFETHTSLAAVPPEVIFPGLGVVAAFLLGVAVIVCLQHCRRRRQASPPPEADLEAFRALQEQGQISREEFERIRVRLASRPGEEPPHEIDS